MKTFKSTLYPSRVSIRYTLILAIILLGISSTADAQMRPQPKWWFGVSAAANANFHSGTTQTLNSEVKAQTAFHDGFGISPFASILAEYRPGPIWGLMLNLGYDGRGGKFDQVMAPCNCEADLKTNLSYLTFEPSLRIAPFSNGFYLYVGGAASYALNKSFTFTQEKKPERTFSTAQGDFSEINNFVFGGHVGLGIDIPLSARTSSTQVNLSPFVSFHPYFGRAPRGIESWSLTTVRAGIAFKFGRVPEKAIAVTPPPPIAILPPPVKSEVDFKVVSPLVVPVKRRINETFPLRNYVFFEEGSSKIPKRYVALNKAEAALFTETQFASNKVQDPEKRSERQLVVYHNILNILGKRMQENPSSTVVLIGASAGNGEALGLEYANEIKKYLVDVYGISPSRITTKGRNQPIIPSEQPGGEKELDLLRAGDRRVDIVTTPNLLAPLKVVAIQPEPEGTVTFNAASGNDIKMKSWKLAITDDKGMVQNFGPYTSEKELISGKTILGDRQSGKFDVVMTAKMEDDSEVVKTSTLNLVRAEDPVEEGLRFTILFDFDKPTTVDAYKKFIHEHIAPLVPANSTVIIHGHTDVIGNPEHNQNLSDQRANGIKVMLENDVKAIGTKGVKYQVHGLGANEKLAPFENELPEERLYNRTVIIDIIPSN